MLQLLNVKKLFSLIGVLITLSVIGIILLQISWLQNMFALGEDKVKQKIDGVLIQTGSQLALYKVQYTPFDNNNFLPGKPLHDILKPPTIGSRFTGQQIQQMIREKFDTAGLHDIHFEYALITGLNGPYPVAERQSAGYNLALADSASNYFTQGFTIPSPPGSAYESLTIDETLVLVAVNWKKVVWRSVIWNIALAILFTLIIVSAFYVTVYTMIRQKKLGDIKNDFINNMTHEFKTPIATISLAVDALKNEKVINDREKMAYFSGIIKEENQRMNKQVETILKASQFEKQEVDLEQKPVHVHEIIKLVADKFQLQLQEKNGKAELYLNAPNDVIKADEVHFTNLVNNLVDNAVKYSKENVPINLRVSSANNNNNKLVLKFEDNGIGMNKETQKRVFEKFYRAHTGNLHNVKGFGLGLNYVKSVTESHHGTIKLDSILGKGSSFTLEFPLSDEEVSAV